MVLALTFDPRIDVTGIATVALTLVTLGLVWVGYHALRQTQAEIDLSRREVEESHRPVVLPVNELGKLDTNNIGRPARPHAESGQLYVPIRNIGAGPALNLIIEVRPLGDQLQPSVQFGQESYVATHIGLAVLRAAQPTVELPGLGANPIGPVDNRDARTSFALTITYEDVAGKAWVTTAIYKYTQDLTLGPGGGYTHLKLSRAE